MKKILYFIQLPPPIHGVTTINKFIYESKKINKTYEIDLLEISYSNTLSQIQKFSFTKIVKHFFIAFKLIKKLIYFKPDYVYFTMVPTGIGFYKDLIFIAIIKFFKTTPVIHFHGKGIEEKTKNKFIKNIYELALSNCIIIHLSSNLLKKEIGGLKLKKAKTCYVENGVKHSTFRIKNKDDSVINILFLSNLFKSKGIFIALDAFRKLALKKKHVVLHLVGGVSDENLLRTIRKIMAENKLYVKIHGSLYGHMKYRILSKADIFIHPTLNDAFPLVILEAMQFKLPVISTFQGAIPEIVEDNVTGFLIEENNPLMLYEKLLFLMENPQIRKSMGNNAYKKYLNNYTLEAFEKNMAKTFNKYLI